MWHFGRQMYFQGNSVRCWKPRREQAVLVLLGQGWKQIPINMLEKFWAGVRMGKILKGRVQWRMVSGGKANGTEGMTSHI